MNGATVTMPLSEHDFNKEIIKQLQDESIENFIKKEHSSLERNEYTVRLDMEKIIEYLDKKYPDRKKVTYKFAEATSLSMKSEQPLLSIALQDESSVPKVVYKGEEVKWKRNILFDWETKSSEGGGLTYIIDNFESKNDTGNKYSATRRIEYNSGDRAY